MPDDYRNRFGPQDCAVHLRPEGGQFVAQPFLVASGGAWQGIVDGQGRIVDFVEPDKGTALRRAIAYLTDRFGAPVSRTA